MIAPSIYINNVSLSFNNHVLFKDLSLELPAGEWVGLLGPSGIGKSSLLKMVGSIFQSATGQGEVSASNHKPVSSQIAYMAQADLLLPWLSVLENAMLGIKLRSHHHSHNKEKAIHLLKQVGLEHVMHFYPSQLSGGMRQRVALVRTLMENKPVVLMDEPFSALDAITRYKLQAIAAHFLKHKTVLFITHDPTEALRLANKIYIMHKQPALLKLVATLDSVIPRELTSTEIIKLQADLFKELSHD